MTVEYKTKVYNISYSDTFMIQFGKMKKPNKCTFTPFNDFQKINTEGSDVEITDDGSKCYEGILKNGKKDLFGLYKWDTYYIYKGLWKDNVKEGKALFETKKTPYVVEASFANDKIDTDKEIVLYSEEGEKICKKLNNEIECYFDKATAVKNKKGFIIKYQDGATMSFTVSNQKCLNDPKMLTKNNNTVKYSLFPGCMIETHAFYNESKKSVIEQGIISIRNLKF